MHKTIIIAILSLIISGFAVDGKKTTIKLKTPVEKTSKGATKYESISREEGDTSAWAGDSVIFTGYDKKATANRESVFVINRTGRNIIMLRAILTYFDMKGRLLHKRQETIYSKIPAGETRKIDISTWDTQKSFYYISSGAPRRQATPYTVKITLLEFQSQK